MFFKNSEYSLEPIVILEIKLRHSFVISIDEIFFLNLNFLPSYEVKLFSSELKHILQYKCSTNISEQLIPNLS